MPSNPQVFRFSFGHHPDALRAFEIQRLRAEAHGQAWSPEHAHALRELHQAYITAALGAGRRREVWPLAVGTGKSESIVAFVRAQYERQLRGKPPLTLLVCMERAAQLRDLFNAIRETGVPPEFVGVFHRKAAAEVAAENLTPSIPLAEAARYPVLLATHAKMLRGDASIAQINTYGETPRSLVVWDESLIKSAGRHLELSRVEEANAILGMRAQDSRSADVRDAHAFLRDRVATLRAAFTARTQGRKGRPVEPAQLTEDDELRYLAALTSTLKDRREDLGSLSAFLEHVQRPVRVLAASNGERYVGIIHFDLLIPPSLSRLIVLDASHNIRDLTSRHDADLTAAPVDCAVKSFEAVTVRHLKAGAGRDTLGRVLPRKDSVLVREIVAEVKNWPTDDAGLVVTFKDERKVSYVEALHAALRREGIDPHATLPNGRRRFEFITWGQHLGVNSYAHCRHVLLVGVLRRPLLDLAAAIAGQREDLTAPQAADHEEIRRAELSEMFHDVYQAAGRGACRNTADGKALPMSLAIICNDVFPEEWWQAAMPGVSVTDWHGKHATPAALRGEHEGAIVAALGRIPSGVFTVSARALKGLAGLDAMRPKPYSRVLRRALLKAPEWRTEGRGLARSPFASVTT